MIELQGDDLVIGIRGPGDSEATLSELADKIVVKDWTNSQNRVEAVRFADNSEYQLKEVSGVITLEPLAMTLSGTSGADSLAGGFGRDTLTGGLGNDTLVGGAGNDSYIFNFGDGQDTVRDNYRYSETFSEVVTSVEHTSGAQGDGYDTVVHTTQQKVVTYDYNAGVDEIVFGAGIKAEHISLQRSGDNLIVYVRDPSNLTQALTDVANKLTLENWFNINERIESFRFSNGDEYIVGIEQTPTTDVYGLTFRSNDVVSMSTPDSLAASQAASPQIVAFDLGGDGLDIIDSSYSAARFDLDGDGYDEVASWFGQSEGILVLDRNHNGQVDGLDELFAATSTAGGMHLLSELDINDDGVINALDVTVDSVTLIEELRLWMDINGNGATELGEWKALHRFGITEIDANPTEVPNEDAVGIRAQGYFARLDDVHPTLGRYYAAQVSFNADGSRVLERGESGHEWVEIEFENGSSQTVQLGSGGPGQTVNASVSRIITGTAAADSYEVEDTVSHSTGTDLGLRGAVINGLSGADTLIGGSGQDVLIGGSGADTLYGGSGDDVVTIDDEDDLANVAGNTGFDALILDGDRALTLDLASKGFEAVVAGNGHDTLWTTSTTATGVLIDGGSGHDTLIGGDGIDRLDGGSGHDTLIGGKGADWLRGGQGTDTVLGGSGDDFIYFETATDLALVDGGSGVDVAIYEGTNGISVLLTSLAIEGVLGGAGNDTLDATGAGDARLLGAGGNDTLIAGSGADRLDGGAGNDWAVYTGSSEALTIDLTGNTAYGAGAGDVLYSIENVEGTSGADVVIGNGADNVFEGHGGGDTFLAGSGTDTVSYAKATSGVVASLLGQNGTGGAAAGDTFASVEILVGSNFADKLVGDSGVNTLFGGDGDDSLIALEGADTLYGGSGIDSVNYAEGSAPSQAVYVDLAAGVAKGGYAEGDVLVSIEAVQGSLANDTLLGTSGSDQFIGNSGADTLVGREGDDQLAGGSGSDSLYGGLGNDIYIFQPGAAADVIAEGQFSTQLATRLTQVETWHSTGGEGEGYYTYSSQTETYTETLYSGGGDDTLVLQNLTAADLVAEFVGGDLVFAVRDPGNPNAAIATLPNRISIKDWSATKQARVEKLVFGDGTSLDIGRLTGSSKITLLDGSNNYHAGISGTDLVAGFGGNDTLRGLQGNDLLFGGTGGDTLFGDEAGSFSFTGADYLDGGSGNDTLVGGRGDDVYSFGRGMAVDTIIDDGGTFIGIPISGGNDTIEFDASVSPGDLLIVRDGNNLIIGLKDSATPDASVTSLADRVVIYNWAQTQDRVEILKFADGSSVSLRDFSSGVQGGQGGSHADTIVGTGTVDEIWAGAGNDTVIAGSGNDVLRGEDGDDTLIGGAGADSLVGGSGSDTVSYEGSSAVYVNLATAAVSGGHAAGDMLTQIENVIGSDGADTLVGNAGGNLFQGGSGTDSLYGGDGGDFLVGGSGQDRLYGGSGDDGYFLVRGLGADTISDSGGGLDYIQLGAGLTPDQMLIERTGNSLIVAIKESGSPMASASSLSDRIVIVDGALTASRVEQIHFADGMGVSLPQVYAGYRGSIGSQLGDTIIGSDANDQIVAFEGADTLWGLSGADLLQGGSGADTMIGASGSDTLEGGAGDDTYLFEIGGGSDTIIESASGQDKIVFGSGIDVTSLTMQLYGADLVIALRNPSDSSADPASLTDRLTIKNWTTSANKIETLAFSDGSTTGLPNLAAGYLGWIGTDSADHIVAATAMDWIEGRDGDDTIEAQGNTDLVFGQTGNDTLRGLGGIDSLYGGSGRDILEGGGAGDFLFGGSGIDAVSYAIASSGVAVSLRDGTRIGAHAVGDVYSGIEGIIGSSFADTLLGNGGDNWLAGGDGVDTLRGYSAADTLQGGSGADVLRGDEGDDVYRFDRGFGADTVVEGDNDTRVVLTTHSEWVSTGGEGEGYWNTWVTTGTETFFTGTGNDVLEFADGIIAEELVYELVGSTLYVALKDPLSPDTPASALPDRIAILNWTSANTRIEGVRLADGTTIALPATLATGIQHHLGSLLNETLSGGTSIDRIVAGSGFDTLVGGESSDQLYGGSGDDVIIGGAGGDTISGGQGIDTVSYVGSGSGVEVTLNGGSGTPSGGDAAGDQLTSIENVIGSSYADTLTGDTLDNVLVGGDGNDTLAGRLGSDTLIGGLGDDVFGFGLGDGFDHVVEDVNGGEDTLVISGITSGEQLWFQQFEDDLVVSIIGTTDKVVIDGWFRDAGGPVERIELSNGSYLLSSNVQQLVDAMAQFDVDGEDPADYYAGSVPGPVAASINLAWQN